MLKKIYSSTIILGLLMLSTVHVAYAASPNWVDTGNTNGPRVFLDTNSQYHYGWNEVYTVKYIGRTGKTEYAQIELKGLRGKEAALLSVDTEYKDTYFIPITRTYMPMTKDKALYNSSRMVLNNLKTKNCPSNVCISGLNGIPVSSEKIDTGNYTPKPSLAPSSKVAETSSTTPSSAKDTRPSGVGNPAGGGGHPGIDAVREPDFGPYMRDVQKRIKSNWDPPEGDKSKRVVLFFKIAKDGSLLSCSVKRTSGKADVDYAAIKAVKQTEPFPPFPPEFKGQSIDIQFTFDYNIIR